MRVVKMVLKISKSNILKIILNELEEAGGAMRDKDLFEILRRDIPDLSMKEFNRYLLILEFNGCIDVSTIGENLRAVNLIKKCQEKEENSSEEES
jgi:hypothetical protein